MENSSTTDVKKEVEVEVTKEKIEEKPLKRVLILNKGGASTEQLFELFLTSLSGKNNGV